MQSSKDCTPLLVGVTDPEPKFQYVALGQAGHASQGENHALHTFEPHDESHVSSTQHHALQSGIGPHCACSAVE